MVGDGNLTDVKWIKITVGMFDDEKIKLIQSMPEGDSILVIWIRLICLGGKCNSGGYVYFSETMPYTEEMLSTIFNKPLQIIRLALKTFQQFGMIEVDTKGLYLVNFGKHQSIDGLEKVRELNAKRNKEYRERRKQLLLSDVTRDVSETVSDGTDIDIELDKEIDKEKNIKIIVPYQKIMDLYNSTCKSLAKIKAMTDSRKDKTKTRWVELKTLDAFKELFEKVEATPFCKGDNKNHWKVTFDWLIENDRNYLKVLEGAYGKQEYSTKESEDNDTKRKGFKEFE